MSKDEKLVKRFLARPRDFTYDELRTLLKNFGYEEDQRGKTSGSRVAFYNKSTKRIIRLHKPHPGNELKMYQLDLIREELVGRDIL
ncbi:MAG: type II toxin-antitoxin system HicA family toxin [Rectinemataceae bacterium]|nr:type II toxin-antitoxin system HicA family toxin [Rectinemataceae bacterium]